MPLPIAHGLLGASVFAALHPKPTSRFYLPLFVGAFLAIAADFDFLLVFIFHSKDWHRGFTHSVTLALIGCFIACWFFGRQRLRQAFAYALAFTSHSILDFLTTKEGGGIQLLSPFSSERFVFGWRGLSELPSKLSAMEIVQALLIELVLFAPLLIAVLFLKKYFFNRNLS